MDFTRPLLLDGATGTQLQLRGMPAGASTELWAAAHPEAIRSVHTGYLDAGSQLIIAATFGANPAALAAHQAADRTESLNRQMVQLARDTAGDRALVAGDVSPTGWLCEPLGDRSFEELYDCYLAQATALEAAGVDCFLLETQMSLADVRAALLAIHAVSQRPVIVSFTVNAQGKTAFGCDMIAALVTVQAMGATAFGLNCSAGPAEMADNLLKLAPYAKIPLLFKPNAGLPQVEDGRTVYHCPPEAYAREVPRLYEAGVRLFGGCCGSEPQHIAALRQALDALPPRPFVPAEGESLASERAVFPVPQGDLPLVPWDEAADEADEDEPIAIDLTAEGVAGLIDDLPLLAGPLCLHCDDAAALAQLLRAYQGRAAYVGGGLTADQLAPLQAAYGLLTL